MVKEADAGVRRSAGQADVQVEGVEQTEPDKDIIVWDTKWRYKVTG